MATLNDLKPETILNATSPSISLPDYRLARIQRYERYANPPLRKPSKLVPFTTGVLVALFYFIGLYPKLVDSTDATFDDPLFSDASDRLVRAVFDKESYTWRKASQGTLVPESLCDRK